MEVAAGGAGGRARGGECGRVTVVTDPVSGRGAAGREGRTGRDRAARVGSGRVGSDPGPALRAERRSGSGPLPARRG